MKKNSLTTAVVAGIAGAVGLANVATAVNLNPDGLGQVLIYPYYGVNNGNNTLVSVINTTDEVKAVKVRFLEALNSREVLDFNLYLSPFDVWVGAVIESDPTDANSAAAIFTNDTSCTVPGIETQTDQTEPFRNFEYTGTRDDDGPNGLDRTREGHIEMIEMGVVEDTNGASFNAATSFADAATHRYVTEGGATVSRPLSCTTLVAAWGNQTGIWGDTSPTATTGNPTFNRAGNLIPIGVTGPTGGLFGGGVIVNVDNGVAFSYNADAVEGFWNLATTNLHSNPGNTFPQLQDGATSALGDFDAVLYAPASPNGVIFLDFDQGLPNAVSSVFMHDSIYNEFNNEAELLGESEWVVTFPTKRLHIEKTTFSERRPFTDNIDDTDGAGQVSAGGDAVDTLVFDPVGSCEAIGVLYFDREEGPRFIDQDPEDFIDFSPTPDVDPDDPIVGPSLCWETNVVTFNQEDEVTAGASSVLGARTIARNLNLGDAPDLSTTIENGWVRMDFDVAVDINGDRTNFMVDGTIGDDRTAARLFGLPVVGFSVSSYNRGGLDNPLANYGTLFKHRGSRDSEEVIVDGDGANDITFTVTGNPAS